MSGDPPPLSVLTLPRKWGGDDDKPIENCTKKRRVRNLYGHTSTLLRSDVTSFTTLLEIEEVNDEDGLNDPTGQSITINGQKGVKEEGMAPAAQTTAPV